MTINVDEKGMEYLKKALYERLCTGFLEAKEADYLTALYESLKKA